MLTILQESALTGGMLPSSQPFAFIIKDDIFFNSVIIFIDDAPVYQNEAAERGYTVVREVRPNGTYFAVSNDNGWPYSALLRIGVFAQVAGWWYRWFLPAVPMIVNPYGEGEPSYADTANWTLQIAEDTSCFIGPINTFEQSLLYPFTTATLQYTETLRAYLLDNAIKQPQANRAVRWLLLRAHDSALAPVLRDLVTTPTVVERQARLCAQRSNFELDQGLRGKGDLLPRVITELQAMGLPAAHAALCTSYDRTDPNLRVPLACVLVCLAKALEVNAIS
jgi:hypothetical protein